jgi:hypothetical protein
MDSRCVGRKDVANAQLSQEGWLATMRSRRDFSSQGVEQKV